MRESLLSKKSAESNSHFYILPWLILLVFFILTLQSLVQRKAESSLGTKSTQGSTVPFESAAEAGPSSSAHSASASTIPLSSSKLEVGNPFPFWELIQKDVWYVEQCGDGVSCLREQPHPCGMAIACFKDILSQNSFLGNAEVNEFFNAFHQESAGPQHHPLPSSGNAPPNTQQEGRAQEEAFAQDTTQRLIQYVSNLIDSPAKRLWHISVSPDHAFLIEQDGSDFRIYQSWIFSFSLKFWTNLQIPIDSICEPGRKVLDMESTDEQSMQMFGILKKGNKAEIEAARTKFGGLQNVGRHDILGLFGAISYGFLLDARAFAPTSTARISNLIPFQQKVEPFSTSPWLGKSAISTANMFIKKEWYKVTLSVLTIPDS